MISKVPDLLNAACRKPEVQIEPKLTDCIAKPKHCVAIQTRVHCPKVLCLEHCQGGGLVTHQHQISGTTINNLARHMLQPVIHHNQTLTKPPASTGMAARWSWSSPVNRHDELTIHACVETMCARLLCIKHLKPSHSWDCDQRRGLMCLGHSCHVIVINDHNHHNRTFTYACNACNYCNLATSLTSISTILPTLTAPCQFCITSTQAWQTSSQETSVIHKHVQTTTEVGSALPIMLHRTDPVTLKSTLHNQIVCIYIYSWI